MPENVNRKRHGFSSVRKPDNHAKCMMVRGSIGIQGHDRPTIFGQKLLGHLHIIHCFYIQFPSSPPDLSMLCCCERDEQTASRIMSDCNIDLGEWGVSSVPALMAKIV